jgi:response regulator RpfG family c-di-GMP phosphodiesterase
MTQACGPHYPLLQQLAEIKGSSAAPGTAPLQGAGVLIIEPEESVRAALARYLRKNAFSVWQAADEQEALAVLRSHRDAIELVMENFRLVRLADLLHSRA